MTQAPCKVTSNALQCHYGIFVFFFLSFFPSPAVSASSKLIWGRVWCCQETSGLFCSLVPWAETPMCTRESAHTCSYPHTHTHTNASLMLFLTVPCAAATFYWWLTTATSKVSLSFDSLICIGSPSQHDSAYLCPQAECQCLFSAYKYPLILYVMYTPGHF